MQVDLVGTEDAGLCERVTLVGSIKWRVRKRFGPDDAKDLADLGQRVPGVDDATLTVGVSRTGFTKDVSLDVMLTPQDVLTAWQR